MKKIIIQTDKMKRYEDAIQQGHISLDLIKILKEDPNNQKKLDAYKKA